MSAMISLAFEDHLVRSIMQNGDPWFVGVDVCRAIGHSNTTVALSRLDPDEVSTLNIGEGQGGPERNIVSEPGVFRLIFTSRRPEAERFKRWLAHDVLPQLRRDGYYGERPQPAADVSPDALPMLTAKLQLVREARMLWGHEKARALWQSVGLPVPALPPTAPSDEARRCLWHLLYAEVATGHAPEGTTYASLISAAIDGDSLSREALRDSGIVAADEGEGFWVLNRHPALKKVFEGTEWSAWGWGRVLRRLPGTALGFPPMQSSLP